MFAEVVPIRRTPFGMDGFDYTFSDEEPYQVGQLVYVSLRGHRIEAVIRVIRSTSAFAKQAKRLDGPIPVTFLLPMECLELLTWVGQRTFSSLPTVLHSWLGTLPKRFPKQPTKTAHPPALSQPAKKSEGQTTAHWQVDHDTALINRAQEALNQGKRVLILTPWTNRVSHFLRALETPERTPLSLHGDLADGAYFSCWSAFLKGDATCLIATRLGAWLSPAADVVLIDEPENDDHKQDEQAPRYDARRLASWAGKYAQTQVEAYGLTPPLHAASHIPELACKVHVHPFHPKGRSNIPTLQADSLLALREHDGPRIIIHPIRGTAARLTCRDCGWQAPCEQCGAALSAEITHAACRTCGKAQALPLTCLACGGADLGKATPGIETLKRAWERFEPEILVEWRDTTSDSLEQPLPEDALVVVTLGHLLGGGIEDLRRTERRVIATRRLMKRVQAAHGELIIQSSEQDLPVWDAWKTATGIQATYAHELETRRVFHYPPTWRRVKCLIEGDERTVQTWLRDATKRLSTIGTIEGPFPIAFRRTGSKPRQVVHLLFEPTFAESSMVELLRPLADRALIDLDPIAFFK